MARVHPFSGHEQDLSFTILTMTDQLTGVYWGAFDPLTEAHLAIIQTALRSEILTSLIIIVNNNSYKTYNCPLEKRLSIIRQIADSLDPAKISIFCQDDNNLLDYQALKNMGLWPLCAIAGYDAYKNWIQHSKPEERGLYEAIAVVPRGMDEPILLDDHAFLLPIDKCYRHISSSKQRTF